MRQPLLVCALIAGLLALFPSSAAAQSETVEYYGTDAIGSIRVVFAADGGVTGRMDPGPFGEPVVSETGIGQRVFAQITFDDESGLGYAEARMYQPRTGRFNAPDAVYAGAQNPQSWNRYSYAANNPLTFVDPTGLNADSCTWTETVSDGVLSGTLNCKDSGGGGGGGGSSFWGDVSWFFSTWADRVTISTTVEASDLVPYSRYRPSQTAQAIDTVAVIAAIVVPPLAKSAAGAIVENAAAKAAAEAVSTATAKPGTILYRVFGGESRGLGTFYTTVNPASVADYRTAAGLFPQNSGSFVLEAVLNDTRGVIVRLAAPGPGGVGGGLPEIIVPNPGTALSIIRVSGVNPRF